MSDSVILVELGARIKDLRKKKNMNQVQLATACNMEKASMSRLEAGRTNPTVFTLHKICKALDANIVDLFEK